MSDQPKLEPVPLKFQLGGRLRNIGKLKHWYMAVAEAVQNSMDSLTDAGTAGDIKVTIERGDDLLSKSGAARPVHSVVISDEGVGFNDVNFESFSTPDSILKLHRGGKGLGRLMCLQAFQRIAIRSVYQNGGGNHRRQVVLQLQTPELAALDEEVSESSRHTEIRLESLREDYASTATVSLEVLTDWLIEHFLPVLVDRPAWLKSLIVQDGKRVLDLTKVVEGRAAWGEQMQIQSYDFRLICYAISSPAKADKVRLVAGGRIVDANTQPLEHYLPHLATISEKQPHLILVHSSFFDEHVNDARNGVSFADESGAELLGVPASEFRTQCGNAMRKHLSDRLNLSEGAFKERVSAVARRDAPYYRPLLEAFFASKEFVGISCVCRDEEILTALDNFKRRDAAKLRVESKRIARLKAEEEGYWESARKLAAQIENQKKVALAEYVALRKIVLETLEHFIEQNVDGKAHRESAIHDLIFPQRTDTESAPGTDHQLWILDERLESHEYLASDQPMNRKRGDRPDLLIALDRPGAFACEPFSRSAGFERVVIVEFKQALKDMDRVKIDDLPHHQMMRYARKISDGKAVRFGSARKIMFTQNGRFYMYAVCEVTEDLLVRLEELGFTRSPQGDGAFWVTNKGSYYIEYISLPKLLEDAKARNMAFFRRLGLEG